MTSPGFTVHPDVYSTFQEHRDLASILEQLWSRLSPNSTIFIASGFANQSGVLTIAKKLDQHTDSGGDVRCYLAGSPHQALASEQAVKELLRSGATVRLLNRKKIFHSKLYGIVEEAGDSLVITSGNLTGNGLSLNVEASLVAGPDFTDSIDFSWFHWERCLIDEFNWHEPLPETINDDTDPAWQLTYDEQRTPQVRPPGDEEAEGQRDEVLALTLVHTDIARIQDPDYPGTPYFWLSRYHATYFPPLQDRTRPDATTTFSTDISVEFIDVGETRDDISVTFEAYNNLDFRLLVSPLRATGLADEGDIAVIARETDTDYKLKIIRQGSQAGHRIRPYLIHEIGNQGKRYGWVPRNEIDDEL